MNKKFKEVIIIPALIVVWAFILSSCGQSEARDLEDAHKEARRQAQSYNP